jgi:hypothetical protein
VNKVYFSGFVQVTEQNATYKGTVGNVPVWTNSTDIGSKLLELNGKYALIEATVSAREKDGKYYNSIFINNVVPTGPDVAAHTLYAYGVIEAARTIKPGFYEYIMRTNGKNRSHYISLTSSEDYTELVGKEATVIANIVGRDGRWLDFRFDRMFVEGVEKVDLPF